ncbi:MAG TPA: hypothetical protein VE842_14260 [Pyrinomonadaceae bacterium]|jgi:hypothetical protein|nr:hypothetical protein [Pyrinomonadaceae bacterium]
MMKRRAITIAIFSCLLALCAAADARAQQFDIGSGGTPTITGTQGGMVTGNTSVLQDLVVTINFGEVSPVNANDMVKVVVPIAIRSTAPYQVAVSVAGAFDGNQQAVQPSDIGFGARNIRQMGGKSQDCTVQHLFRSPFNNDPSTVVTLNANGRAAYTSSLQNITASTVILSGPRLTRGGLTRRDVDNGYIFDAIFTIKPQYYVSGTFSATITFTISAGPPVGC